MSASMLTLRCASLCALGACARAAAGDFPFASCGTSFEREANGREPGLVMYCVSVKLHREGLVWSGFS